MARTADLSDDAIERIASDCEIETDMWRMGAGSHVYSAGCEGVSRHDFECFAQAVFRLGIAGGAETEHKASISIAPRPGTYSAGDPSSDFWQTRSAFWYRMRNQRECGWPNEPACHFLKLNWYDGAGRLWQHACPAVVDDFGDLVEVRQ